MHDENQVTYRRAVARDLDGLVALWDDMMLEHGRRNARVRLAEGALSAYRGYLSYHLSREESLILVAEAGGRLVGFCLSTVSRNLAMFLPALFGYLSDLVVDAAWRRRGIGRALFGASMDWLRARRIETVQLQYYYLNEAGEAFWRAMGFEPFYTRMWLDLADGERR